MQNNGFKYYRECPTCGHREEISVSDLPVAKPTPMIKKPIKPQAPEEIVNLNEHGGGTVAGFR